MSADSGFQLQQGAAERYQRETAVFMRPLVTGLLDAAELQPGQRVLDLACGTGIATIEAAARVGPSGSVVGADLNPGMIEVARQAPPAAAPVEWHVANAMELPFDDEAFDAVVVQQGVPFFPDLAAALDEMRRVTRPGGVVAATSWTPMETNPYFHAQYAGLGEALGEAEVASLADAFALTGDRLEEAWGAAGLTALTRTVHAPSVTLPPLDGYVGRQLDATPWGTLFRSLDESGQRRVVERVCDLLSPHTVGGTTTVPFSTWVVTGRA